MGNLINITCKNKACRYHVELHQGVGFNGFARKELLKEDLLAGKVQNEAALERLKKGAELDSGGIYLCPTCKEFLYDPKHYLIENITYSPYGTARYDVSFPFGKPHCKKCGTELEFIKNVLSAKVKCPRCGGDLKARHKGFFD